MNQFVSIARRPADDARARSAYVEGGTVRLPWRHASARAGLEDVRIHVLQHRFASVAAGASLGLPIIGNLLGHTQAATTSRYAHHADDPLHGHVGSAP